MTYYKKSIINKKSNKTYILFLLTIYMLFLHMHISFKYDHKNINIIIKNIKY
jgi:hypothetical protein